MKLPKMVVLLLNGTQYAMPKHCSRQYTRQKYGGKQYAKGCHPHGNGLCMNYLSGLGFQIKYIVTKVRKTTTFCLKHSLCKKVNA